MATPVEPVEGPPLLRGWLHLVCAGLALPAGAVLIVRARESDAAWGAVVYMGGMFVMFSVSAAYHRGRWSVRGRPWMKRADHAAIFGMIAATYTPICLTVLRDGLLSWLLPVIGVAAGLGVIGAFTGLAERRIVGLVSYSVLGWAAVLAMPRLARHLNPLELALLITGGALYSLGSIGLGLRWPNPLPRTFGYHEVWHVLVALAVACHFVVIWALVG